MSPSQSLDQALNILAAESEAALASMEGSAPFTSAVGYVYEKSGQSEKPGRIYLLLSDLARHTKNIKKNPAVSFLVISRAHEVPVHEKERMSVQGKISLVSDKEKFIELKALYLKTFPRAEIFFTLPDFRFYVLDISGIHWIGGFGRAERWEF